MIGKGEIASSERIIAPKAIIYEKNRRHIFRDSSGHILSDTPQNRQLMINTASNPRNYLGQDKFGNMWHAEIRSDGTQIWT